MSALASRLTLVFRGARPWAGPPDLRLVPLPFFPTSRRRGQVMPGPMLARLSPYEPSCQPSNCSRLTSQSLARHFALASCLVLLVVVRAPRHLTRAGEVGLTLLLHGFETSSRFSYRRTATGA